MVHKILNTSLVTKAIKETRPLCIFFLEISIYEIYSDKTKCRFFMIKDEKLFDEYMTIWKKVSNIIKNTNFELTSNKKYLKAENSFISR